MSIILFIYVSLFDAVGAEGVENEDGIKKGFVQPPPNDTFLEKCVDSKLNIIFNWGCPIYFFSTVLNEWLFL